MMRIHGSSATSKTTAKINNKSIACGPSQCTIAKVG
jgi:hypothetical protein